MNVVILSGHSLFAAGIARRLRQYLQLMELETIDPRHPDAMSLIAATQPSIVIMDVTDSDVTRFCPLSKLLLSFPQLKVICLDPQQNYVQVVTGEQHKAVQVRDLVEVIEQTW